MLAKLEQRETQLHTSLEHKAQSAHRELQQLQLRQCCHDPHRQGMRQANH